MTTPSKQPVTTVRLQRMVRAYRESAGLMAAVELGVFTQVARGADTEEALIAALGIDPVQAERIIVACIALDLMRRDGDRLVLTPDVERYLVEGEPGYAGTWMLFTKPDWDGWGRLSDRLKEPLPDRIDNPTVAGISVEEARRYHDATASIGRGAGRLFLRQVDLTGRRLMLDLGGGSGAYCIEACRKHPDLKAIVFDLPPVAEVARDFIRDAGMEGRVEAVAGDFNRDPFPDGADVVVMASNLPMYGRQEIRAVIAKAFAALVPGGEMHLIGEALDENRSGPADAALWGLSEAVKGSTGLAHSVAEVEGYFREAGFTDIGRQDFVPGVLIRVGGRKPG